MSHQDAGGEFETVYATAPEPEGQEKTSDDDEPLHRQKAWLYQQYHVYGKSMKELADASGVSTRTIGRQMDRHDIPRRSISEARTPDKRLLDEEWCRKQYVENKLSLYEIAEKIGVSHSSVHRALDNFNIERRERVEAIGMALREKFEVQRLEDEEWLQHQYRTLGKSTEQISEIVSCDKVTVLKALKNHSIPVRSQSVAQLNRYKQEKCPPNQNTRKLVSSKGIDASWRNIQDVDRSCYIEYRDPKWLRKQVKDGLSTRQIANKCGADVSASTVGRWINRFGIETP